MRGHCAYGGKWGINPQTCRAPNCSERGGRIMARGSKSKYASKQNEKQSISKRARKARHIEERRRAVLLVATTKLNCIARKPRRRASCRQCSAIARPIPRPRADGETMKPALATCDPSPGWLALRM